MAGAEPIIGTLNENPLHAALKQWYAEPGDLLEQPVDGYVVDIVRGELLIEIQTAGLYPVREKLRDLTAERRVRLVCPLPQDKWLVKLPHEPHCEPERRLSPKHCGPLHIFEELVRIPRLLAEPNFALEVLLTRQEEVRRREPGRCWRRRGWLVKERRLVDVLERHLLGRPADALALLPDCLPSEFTTAELARCAEIARALAQKACYCLRKMGLIRQSRRDRSGIVYRIAA